MRMKKYITLDQLIEWANSTAPFVFDGVSVDPSAQWEAINTTIKPLLDGSLDNPYSTTSPKEKLPQYFSTAEAIGIYLNEEYGDRLVAVPFRGGEYYPKLGRNLNKDEAMEVIIQELIYKATNFISIYGFQFIKKIGIFDIKYNPIWNVDGTERTVYDFGQHVTTDQYGNKKQTQQHAQQTITNNYDEVELTDNFAKTTEEIEYGNTSQETTYSQQQLTDNIDGTTDTHSETTMDNTAAFRNKTQDIHSGHTDTHIADPHTEKTDADTHVDTREVAAKSDTHTTAAREDVETHAAYTDTIADDTHTDTNTSQSHQNVETKERHGNIGVTSTQELISQERQLLDFNPAIDFFNAFINKICLSCYCY